MFRRGWRRGSKSPERRARTSISRPFVEPLEDRSLLASTGWQEPVTVLGPSLGLLASDVAQGPDAAEWILLTGVPQGQRESSADNEPGDSVVHFPRLPGAGKLPPPAFLPATPVDRHTTPPPEEPPEDPPGESPPPPDPSKDPETPPHPPGSDPPGHPTEDPQPDDQTPPDERVPDAPPPPPDSGKNRDSGPEEGSAPARDPERETSPEPLTPPNSGHGPREVRDDGRKLEGFGTDLWDLRRWDGVATPTTAVGFRSVEEVSLFRETPSAMLAAGRPLSRSWAARALADITSANQDALIETGEARLVNLDPLATALLSRAWEKARGGGESAGPGTPPDQFRPTLEPNQAGSGQVQAGTPRLLAPALTGWVGETAAFPALVFNATEAAWAVARVAAETTQASSQDLASGAPALSAEATVWDALATGTGNALLQSSGPAGGSQAGAVAEEDRTPWELLFSPLLFGFATPRHYQATILLIEHDEPTRDAFHELLAHQGYLVLAAGTAHDAWGLIRAPLAPIDLVLLDAHLPDVSGMMLYARLREVYPNLPVVVCTGGELDPDELARFRDMGAPFYLRKPIAQEKLLATVQAVLR